MELEYIAEKSPPSLHGSNRNYDAQHVMPTIVEHPSAVVVEPWLHDT